MPLHLAIYEIQTLPTNCTWSPNEATQKCPTAPYTGDFVGERRSPSRRAAHYRGHNGSVAPISQASSITLPVDESPAIVEPRSHNVSPDHQNSTYGVPPSFQRAEFSSPPRYGTRVWVNALQYKRVHTVCVYVVYMACFLCRRNMPSTYRFPTVHTLLSRC